MQSHELLREVLKGQSAKQVAADLGLSLSMIYKWSEPPDNAAGSGTPNPLDRIAALQRATGDVRLIQWLCERADGYFVRNPPVKSDEPQHLFPATNEVVQEFADLLAVVATAAGDNHISHSEAASIRARWEELKTATEGFVRCCEEGNFTRIRGDSPPPVTPAKSPDATKSPRRPVPQRPTPPAAPAPADPTHRRR